MSAVLNARAEASAWIARLHGMDRTPDMEAGFRRWLAERPENAQEFEALTGIWDEVIGAAAAGMPRVAPSQMARPERASRRTSLFPLPRPWAPVAAALAICGLFAIGVLLVWNASRYTTGIGEQRIVLLSDGTRVSLNSNTRLRASYRDERRDVILERGEAFFEVARDASRPFVVSAGDHRVTALGTSFMVRYEHDETAVVLVEGKITVQNGSGAASAPQAAAAPATRLLKPGERLTVTAAKAETLDRPRVEAVTAWRRGEVVLDDTRLGAAAAEMNRYDTTQIVVEGSEADLAISGLYHAGDSEGFAQAVATLYGLELRRENDRIFLKSR